MEKIRISIPENILYRTRFTVGPDDINEAGHMGNERILVHANRIRHDFLEALGLVLPVGYGLIVANHSMQYRSEGFLGDAIEVEAGTAQPTECSFDLVLHFIKADGRSLAVLRSGLVCFDYGHRKIRPLPEPFRALFCIYCRPGTIPSHSCLPDNRSL